MTKIADDNTLDAALYGSAHMETILVSEGGARILEVLEFRLAHTLRNADLDGVEEVLTEHPDFVYSDCPVDELEESAAEAVTKAREIAKLTLSIRKVTEWMRSADHRGRLIGTGEHSARACVSGNADYVYKMANLRRKEYA